MESISGICPKSEITDRTKSDKLWNIAQYSEYAKISMEDFWENTYWVDLPGRGLFPTSVLCGEIRSVHRCQGDGHHMKPVFNSCNLYQCPICWNTWLSKAANRVSQRIFQWLVHNDYESVAHWVISPPKDFSLENYKEVVKNVKEIFQTGVCGGYTLIFHAYRGKCNLCGQSDEVCKCWMDSNYKQNELMVFEYSPHWHLTTEIDYIEDIAVKYAEFGFILRKISDVPLHDLYKMYRYELGHCSKRPHSHAIKYFGSWTYRKYRQVDEVDISCEVNCSERDKDDHVCNAPMDDYYVLTSKPVSDWGDEFWFYELMYLDRAVYKRTVKLFFTWSEFQMKLKFARKKMYAVSGDIPNFVEELWLGYCVAQPLNRVDC